MLIGPELTLGMLETRFNEPPNRKPFLPPPSPSRPPSRFSLRLFPLLIVVVIVFFLSFSLCLSETRQLRISLLLRVIDTTADATYLPTRLAALEMHQDSLRWNYALVARRGREYEINRDSGDA